jgi:hypothetical protein
LYVSFAAGALHEERYSDPHLTVPSWFFINCSVEWFYTLYPSVARFSGQRLVRGQNLRQYLRVAT